MSRVKASHVLITGSHRSGTTWVGKVVASGRKAIYIHEPFNVAHPNPHTAVRMKYWYQWVKDGADERERRAFEELLSLRLRHGRVGWRGAMDPLQLAKRIGAHARDRVRVWRGHHLVLKDPMALLSAPWLARNFEVRPVVCIRHPAAFVSSLRVKNWLFDFSHFVAQPGLVDEYFPQEETRLVEVARRQTREIVSESAYLWRLLHQAISKFRREYPGWIFVRHEDLSREAEREFRKMFAALCLPYAPETVAYLKSTIATSDTRYVSASSRVSDVARNSAENVMVWKQRLSHAEITTIRRIVDVTAAEFYSDDEW